MRFSNTFYSNFLQVTWGIFEKIRNFPEFLAVIAEYGYDNARIEEGKALYDAFSKYHHQYLEKRQVSYSKTKALDALFRKVFKQYANFVKRLRWELKGDLETRTVLGAKGYRERTRAGFIDQATNFYNMAMKSETLSKIERYGVSIEKLQGGLQLVREYHDFCNVCDSLRGECQELIEKRNQAYLTLRDWMTAFITSSKIAYAGNLQTLEKLGMFMLNRPRRKREDENPETLAAKKMTAKKASAEQVEAVDVVPVEQESEASELAG